MGIMSSIVSWVSNAISIAFSTLLDIEIIYMIKITIYII